MKSECGPHFYNVFSATLICYGQLFFLGLCPSEPTRYHIDITGTELITSGIITTSFILCFLFHLIHIILDKVINETLSQW